ncbi:multi-sensor hybrid histidine kinase [Candidatus Vecturithrix granuli]|uniref:histidine kinase n=1 Tax=Vecturithrix granuli TaxID=1499967 RepID=A0A081C0N2_VECG1|nr:multi-sensor hybrid histidine kinase [Candidatus Vecturithrix granuli]
MNIRQKTLTIIGIAFVILLVVLTLISHLVILGGFTQLETEDVKVNVKRSLNELSNTLDWLNATAGDWAPWDDTYYFIQNHNEEYIQSNLSDATLTTLGINFMIFINLNGEIVYAKNVDFISGSAVPFPDDLIKRIASNRFLLTHSDTESSKAGLITLSSLPVYLISRPILKSDFSGPIQGTLLVGRYIDRTEIEQLSQKTHLQMSILPLQSSSLELADQEAYVALTEDPEQIIIQRRDSTTIAGYALQHDIFGKPAFIVKIELPRKIADHGRMTLVYYILSLLTTGLVSMILIRRLLDTIVLSPLTELSNKVREIGTHGDASQRLCIRKQDELGHLAHTINLMLEHLLETRKNLEVANRVKSDFLSIISHELRTPLVPIISNTELLLWEEEENNRVGHQKEYLQDILKYSQELHHLINDILDLSNLETGEMELSMSAVDLRRLLENSLNIVKEKARKHQISLSLNLQDLPTTMNADERKLKQVLYSLLSNAIKFTPDGGSVTLTAQMNPSNDKTRPVVEICVQDTGIGMEQAEIQRIFHPFEQLEHPLTRKYSGAGLGLTLAQKIIELHGGTIAAESGGKGKGSLFCIRLPIDR